MDGSRAAFAVFAACGALFATLACGICPCVGAAMSAGLYQTFWLDIYCLAERKKKHQTTRLIGLATVAYVLGYGILAAAVGFASSWLMILAVVAWWATLSFCDSCKANFRKEGKSVTGSEI